MDRSSLVTLSPIDWVLIAGYFLFALAVGLWMRNRASRNVDEYFLSGRSLPWWLAGTSMVATSFAADTPLFVSGVVRDFGIWKNWLWWCQAVSGVLSVFLFARWWRRGRVMTKAELTELRYSGKEAEVLRGFLGLLHSLIVNVIVLCWVILAATKIFDVLFDFDKTTSVIVACGIALTYSLMSGFWGVVITDLVQFAMSMLGAIVLAIVCWDAVGGSEKILELAQSSPAFTPETLRFMPPPGTGNFWELSFWTTSVAAMAVYLCVGWWAVETVDGGGHAIQRISASRDERQGMLATLWYTIAHYAIRPWPWLMVGIASLVVLPRLEVHAPVGGTVTAVVTQANLNVAGADSATVPIAPDTYGTIQIEASSGERSNVPIVQEADDWRAERILVKPKDQVAAGDLMARSDSETAYIVMLSRYLMPGFKGLVVASLLAAFMSTIDTHVNLASSFFVNDIYRRFMVPNATSDRHYVLVARLASLTVMILAGVMAAQTESIRKLFEFFLVFLAGVGPVYVLRWFWWRVSAWTEITALATSAITATLLSNAPIVWSLGPLSTGGALEPAGRTLIVAAASLLTCGISLLIAPTRDPQTVVGFYRKVRPIGWWKPVRELTPETTTRDPVAGPIVGTIGGILLIFGVLFGVGSWLLHRPTLLPCLVASVSGAVAVWWAISNLEPRK